MLQSLIFWQAFSGIDMNQKPFNYQFYSLPAVVFQLLPSHHLSEAPGYAFASSLDVRPLKMCHEDLVVNVGRLLERRPGLFGHGVSVERYLP